MVISAQSNDLYKRQALRAIKTKLLQARTLGFLAVLLVLGGSWSRSAQADDGWIDVGRGLALVAAAQIGKPGSWHRWAVVTGGLIEQPHGALPAPHRRWPLAAMSLATDEPPWRPLEKVVAVNLPLRETQVFDLAPPMLAGLGLGALILLVGWGLTRPAESAKGDWL